MAEKDVYVPEGAEQAIRAILFGRLPSAPLIREGTRCPGCGGSLLHTTAYGDIACRTCQHQWRGPSGPNSASCPQCNSGRVNRNAYGDWVCRDCASQWR